ncbi:TolC family protein [Sulfitobacter sp.]|nr:TolC family protein [Sulfitobacter sp.]
MKFKVSVVIFFQILNANFVSAACYKQSLPYLENFIERTRNLPLKSESFLQKLAVINNDISALINESKTNSTRLKYDYNIRENTNTFSLSTDLSVWKRKARKNSFQAKIDQQDNEINVLKNSQYFKKADAIFSILSSRAYLDIFSKRRELLEALSKFYDTRITMGAGEFQKKTQIEQDIINLNDKDMSARIRIESLLLQHELTKEDISNFQYLGDTIDYNQQDFCKDLPRSLQTIELQIKIKQKELEEAKAKLYPNLIGSASSAINDFGSNESVGLTLSFTLYDGNKKSFQISQLKDTIKELEFQRKIFLLDLDQLFKERILVDKILLSSLSSLEKNVSDKLQTINQLNIKKSLGGSVFEERVQALIESSMLAEARVGIVSDLISSWINLTYLRGEMFYDEQ